MLLRKSKKRFLNLIKETKVNCKNLWRSMDKILGRKNIYEEHLQLKINGMVQSDDFILAKHFNGYFLDAVLDLAENFSKVKCCWADHSNSNVSYCRLQSIDEDKFSKIIAKVKQMISLELTMFKKTSNDYNSSTNDGCESIYKWR